MLIFPIVIAAFSAVSDIIKVLYCFIFFLNIVLYVRALLTAKSVTINFRFLLYFLVDYEISRDFFFDESIYRYFRDNLVVRSQVQKKTDKHTTKVETRKLDSLRD